MAEGAERDQDPDDEAPSERVESVDVDGRDTLVSVEGAGAAPETEAAPGIEAAPEAEAAPGGGPTATERGRGNEGPGDSPGSPAESFGRGLGMLWQAARGAATGLRQEVQQSGARDALRDAGRQLEGAASTALRGVEQLVRAVGKPVAGGSAGGTGAEERDAQEPTAEAADGEERSATPADSAEPSTTPEPAGTRIALDDEES